MKATRVCARTARYLVAPLVILMLLGNVAPARAVILYRSDQRNTDPPTGKLADSGWQYQGQWGSFLGTPIAPHYFITANHVGGSVGQTFQFGPDSYTTTARYMNGLGDISLWQVDKAFPTYAPLYVPRKLTSSGSVEAGKQVMLFGRGTARGDEVRNRSGELKGWQWGGYDGAMSWGQNTIDQALYVGFTQCFKLTFDATGGENEAALSFGDSGGGMFIFDKGQWRLAGINHAVDGPFSVTGTAGSGFNGALFDERGLYTGVDPNWSLITSSSASLPSSSYVTRLSWYSLWMNDIISADLAAASAPVPEPTSSILTLLCAAGLISSRREGRRRADR